MLRGEEETARVLYPTTAFALPLPLSFSLSLTPPFFHFFFSRKHGRVAARGGPLLRWATYVALPGLVLLPRGLLYVSVIHACCEAPDSGAGTRPAPRVAAVWQHVLSTAAAGRGPNVDSKSEQQPVMDGCACNEAKTTSKQREKECEERNQWWRVRCARACGAAHTERVRGCARVRLLLGGSVRPLMPACRTGASRLSPSLSLLLLVPDASTTSLAPATLLTTFRRCLLLRCADSCSSAT